MKQIGGRVREGLHRRVKSSASATWSASNSAAEVGASTDEVDSGKGLHHRVSSLREHGHSRTHASFDLIADQILESIESGSRLGLSHGLPVTFRAHVVCAVSVDGAALSRSSKRFLTVRFGKLEELYKPDSSVPLWSFDLFRAKFRKQPDFTATIEMALTESAFEQGRESASRVTLVFASIHEREKFEHILRVAMSQSVHRLYHIGHRVEYHRSAKPTAAGIQTPEIRSAWSLEGKRLSSAWIYRLPPLEDLQSSDIVTLALRVNASKITHARRVEGIYETPGRLIVMKEFATCPLDAGAVLSAGKHVLSKPATAAELALSAALRNPQLLLRAILESFATLHEQGKCYLSLGVLPDSVALCGSANADGAVQAKLDRFDLMHITTSEELIERIGGLNIFVAPEVARKESFNGSAVDIWALGAMSYVLLAQRSPYRVHSSSGSTFEMLSALRSGRVDLSPAALATLAPAAAEWLRRSLQVDPGQRISARLALKLPFFESPRPVALTRKPSAQPHSPPSLPQTSD